MTNFNRLEISMYKISVKDNYLRKLDLPINMTDFEVFIQDTLLYLLEDDKSCQFFEFNNENELVAGRLKANLHGEPWDNIIESIADKLYSAELNAHDSIKQTGRSVRAGAFLQIKLEHNQETKFIFLKIDDDSFFDEDDFKIKAGLPTSKTRVQRSAIITYKDVNVSPEISISDSVISKYWYKAFLVASHCRDPEANTSNTFKAIENFFARRLKKDCSADFIHLKNETIGYFKRNDRFNFTEFFDDVVKSYTPITDEMSNKLDDFVKNFKELPTMKSSNFDTEFEIKPEVIEKKLIQNITFGDNFELRIKGEVEDFKNKIVPGKDDDFRKYIKIYSDDGYYKFGGDKD